LLVGLIKVLKDNYNETSELPQKRQPGEQDIGNNVEISLLQKALYLFHYAILLNVSN
jgi:hypothetical protein